MAGLETKVAMGGVDVEVDESGGRGSVGLGSQMGAAESVPVAVKAGEEESLRGSRRGWQHLNTTLNYHPVPEQMTRSIGSVERRLYTQVKDSMRKAWVL